jgi:hypothetical protein
VAAAGVITVMIMLVLVITILTACSTLLAVLVTLHRLAGR